MMPEIARYLRTPAGQLTAGELRDLGLAVAARQAARQLAKDPAGRREPDRNEALQSVFADEEDR
jgi:hypothetical protein